MVSRTSLYGPTDSLWAVDYLPGFMQRQQLLSRTHWERIRGCGVQMAVINLHNGVTQTNARQNLRNARLAKMSVAGYVLLWSAESASDMFAAQQNQQRHPTHQITAAYNAVTDSGADQGDWDAMRFIGVGLRKNVHPLNGDAHNYKQSSPADARLAIGRIEALGSAPAWIYTDRNYYENFFLRFARAAPDPDFSFEIHNDQYQPLGYHDVDQVLTTADRLQSDDEFSRRMLWDRDLVNINQVGDVN